MLDTKHLNPEGFRENYFGISGMRACQVPVPQDTIRNVSINRAAAPPPRAAPKRPSVTLDDVSKRIIELLQHDGRKSYASMALEVGLSEAAVRQRVQRLLDADVMQIVAVTDPLQLGFQRQAMVGLRVGGDVTPVAEALTAMTEVSYAVTTAGSFDLLVEVVCEDDDHLLELVTQRFRSIKNVTATETFVYLKLNKQLYNWGTR